VAQGADFSSNGDSMRIDHGALRLERTRTRAARRERVASPIGNYWYQAGGPYPHRRAGSAGKARDRHARHLRAGARIRKHYHTGQVVFYILEGTMAVQHEDGSLMTLKAGDSLLIKPGTVHAHWNASSALPLVFTEFIIVDEGQRSAVFVE
jgi:mannose-6-phosphate isomerase-like protein (cupin superfamily)